LANGRNSQIFSMKKADGASISKKKPGALLMQQAGQ
jgi:hypothetical protein